MRAKLEALMRSGGLAVALIAGVMVLVVGGVLAFGGDDGPSATRASRSEGGGIVLQDGDRGGDTRDHTPAPTGPTGSLRPVQTPDDGRCDDDDDRPDDHDAGDHRWDDDCLDDDDHGDGHDDLNDVDDHDDRDEHDDRDDEHDDREDDDGPGRR